MLSLNEQVAAVCHLLAAEGYDFVVAGGFARDTVAGVTPKDADICVYGRWGMRLHQVGIPYSVCAWADSNALPWDTVEVYDDDDSNFAARCMGVTKLGDVDVIFSRAHSWQEVLNGFDVNINQFYFPSSIPRQDYGEHGRGGPELVGYSPQFNRGDVAFGGQLDCLLCSGLVVLRDDAGEERVSYMLTKWANIGPAIMDWAWEQVWVV